MLVKPEVKELLIRSERTFNKLSEAKQISNVKHCQQIDKILLLENLLI